MLSDVIFEDLELVSFLGSLLEYLSWIGIRGMGRRKKKKGVSEGDGLGMDLGWC